VNRRTAIGMSLVLGMNGSWLRSIALWHDIVGCRTGTFGVPSFQARHFAEVSKPIRLRAPGSYRSDFLAITWKGTCWLVRRMGSVRLLDSTIPKVLPLCLSLGRDVGPGRGRMDLARGEIYLQALMDYLPDNICAKDQVGRFPSDQQALARLFERADPNGQSDISISLPPSMRDPPPFTMSNRY